MKELSPYFIRRTVPPPGAETVVLAEPVVEEEVHLRDYWRVIRKHTWFIAAFFFGVVLTTALVVFMMAPIYTAETLLLIERKSPQVLDIQQVLSESLGSDEYDYYKTQYEILKSRGLAAQVIREQGLEKNSLFTGKEKKGLAAGLWAQGKRWLYEWVQEQMWAQGLLSSLSPSRANGSDPSAIDPELVDTYIDGMLDIEPAGRTRLVTVAFSTPDPELSARVANEHAKAYIRQGLKLRTQASEEAQNFLEEKLVELKERVEKSEAALNRYRRDKGIISLDDKENIVVERLADLNKRLTQAEVERITLEAQARIIRKRDYDSLPAVINSTLIQTLKEQLARLEGEHAHLSAQFKPGYPPLAQLQAQVEEMRRRLRQEIQKVVGGIESAYLAAEATEKELRAKMEEQKAAALSLKDASVEYAILAREVDTNRQLYDSVLQRMREMGVAAELRASNVFVIDAAEPPVKPSSPKKALSLLLSTLVGLMGGVGLAFFLEYLDSTLKTREDVERHLHLPNLGVVPDFLRLNHRSYGYAPTPAKIGARDRGPDPNSGSRASGKELVLSHHPLSVVSEAYRTIRTAIVLSRAGEPPKTILFTSGVHAEGKTVTAANIAIIFAQMSVRVLVIDADLRRPRCHKVLGVQNGLGLTEVLTGQREPGEVIHPTATSNLFLLSSGSIPPNPAELLGSKKMQEALALLAEQYDYILIDSPPVLPVADAMLLSTIVDGVVLVVNGQETPRHIAREARSRLSYARAKILGVVLNRVNIQSGDYAYYYSHYDAYYHHVGVEEAE